jgi:hypothetical protein
MNLSEDLIRYISKYNPKFSLINKEFNQYYKKINNAAKIIQKYYQSYKIYKDSYCEYCGEYHQNFLTSTFFQSYYYTPNYNVDRYWNNEITINYIFENITPNYEKREKRDKKKKYLSHKQNVKIKKRNFKKTKQFKIRKRKYSFR